MRTRIVAPQYRGFLKKSVKDLPTPALLIDLDIFERNLQALASYMKGRAVTFRPHGKAHKSPAIGKLQLASGAKGLCAAKLGEADVLIRGGIKDVLITAEVVGQLKIERLMSASRHHARRQGGRGQRAERDRSLDGGAGIEAEAEGRHRRQRRPEPHRARHAGRRRRARAGDREAEGSRTRRAPGLRRQQPARRSDSRTARAREVQSNERVVAARQALEKAGFAVQMVSVGGTGSYNIDADFPGVTEIQPGSYIFMDSHYNKIGGRTRPTSPSSATRCRCSRRSSAAPSAGAPSSMPAARRCRPTNRSPSRWT